MHGKVFEIKKLSTQFTVPCSDKNHAYSIWSKRRCLGFEVESSRFSKNFLALTLELILLKSVKLVALETDGFLSYWRSLQNSPEVKTNDLGLFSSLKYHAGQICTHCASRDEMMANHVIKAFDEYPADKFIETTDPGEGGLVSVNQVYHKML